MRDIGLVGVPFSGKSTLFTALTRAGSHGGQANVAVVPVPDPRLAVLTEMEHSKKTVPAQVRFVDVPGGTSSAQGVAKLRESDALAVVVRCFGADRKPAQELAEVRAELLLADLAVVESALEKGLKRAKGRPGPEVHALQRAKDALDAERPLRDAGLDEQELAHLRGDRLPDAEARGRDREPRGGRGASGRARRCGRRLRLDRGRDDGDGPRGGAGAARGVRRGGAGPGARDRRGLRRVGPHHVPDDRRRRDACLGGPARRQGAGGRRRDPHRPGARLHPRRGDLLRRARGVGSMDSAKRPASCAWKARTTSCRKATSCTSASPFEVYTPPIPEPRQATPPKAFRSRPLRPRCRLGRLARRRPTPCRPRWFGSSARPRRSAGSLACCRRCRRSLRAGCAGRPVLRTRPDPRRSRAPELDRCGTTRPSPQRHDEVAFPFRPTNACAEADAPSKNGVVVRVMVTSVASVAVWTSIVIEDPWRHAEQRIGRAAREASRHHPRPRRPSCRPSVHSKPAVQPRFVSPP